MFTCPICGKQHPASARFCPETGQPIPYFDPRYPPPPPRRGRTGLWIGITLAALLLAAAAIWMFYRPPAASQEIETTVDPGPLLALSPSETPLPEPPPTDIPTPTAAPTFTPLPPTPTEIPPSPTPAYITRANPVDNAPIVFVEAGPFTMGSDPAQDPYFWGAESPQFTVTVGSFWIYQTEVTNAMYRECRAAHACPLPAGKASRDHQDYYENPLYNNYPVINVPYLSAAAYCNWARGRLPTEAEWEKAARGSADARLFPWGNEPASAAQANFCGRCPEPPSHQTPGQDDGYPATSPVGSFPAGVSPYGALDLAGNVWEWTFDWFTPTYQVSQHDNPRGPASGKYRAIRGGSWSNPAAGVRIVQRDGLRPDLSLDTLGFRCVVEDTR